MGRYKDHTGEKYNRLTFIQYDHTSNNHHDAYWLCRCDCGNEKVIKAYNVISGYTKSCGCLQKEITSKRSIKDLTDKKFGRLTAKYITGVKNQRTIWHCVCDCGNECNVVGSDLSSGHTQSCGCLAREILSQNRINNLTGQKFDKLLVIEDTGKRNNNGSVIWKCLCDCGNYCEKDSHSLTQGRVHSCGCIKSLGEAKITQLLQAAFIPFTREVHIVYDDGSYGRLDFMVNDTYAIEYDGNQHHDENNPWYRPEADIKKDEYCKAHNIPLIRIPYTKLDALTIEDLLLD